MKLHVLPQDDPRARPGLFQFEQDINGKPFAAMLSTKLLDRFAHPEYPWRWTLYLACKVQNSATEMPERDEFEAVKTFALRVFDRLNLEFDLRFVGVTAHRKNVEMMFVAGEADFARIAGTLADHLPSEFGADQWRFRKYESARDPAWKGLADLCQVMRRHVARPGLPVAQRLDHAIELRARAQVKLHSQREIRLQELQQRRTYEGLLMGLPTAERNSELLAGLPAKHHHYGRPAYLVKPVEEPLPYPHPSGEPYPFGTPAALPPILCMARFESFQPARDQSADASGLAVVWFQRQFALPVDADVLEAIAAIEWADYAGDFSY